MRNFFYKPNCTAVYFGGFFVAQLRGLVNSTAVYFPVKGGRCNIEMNWMRKFTLFLLCWFSLNAIGEEFPISRERLGMLSTAYGFAIGQQASLDMIEKKYPELARDVKITRLEFDKSDLALGVKGVEEELSKGFGDKFPAFKKSLTDQIISTNQEQALTPQLAVDFLREVQLRAKGELAESVKVTLLSANPHFVKDPSLEFSSGWRQKYRTKDHPKAKGVDFSISFPASWSKREGERPNVIQVFQNTGRPEIVMGNLMVKASGWPAGYKPADAEVREVVRASVPDDGRFVDFRPIVLEGAPGGILVWDQTLQRLEFTLTTRITAFMIYSGNHLIFIQFAVSVPPKSKETLDSLQQKYFPAFKAIANTFILNDNYK